MDPIKTTIDTYNSFAQTYKDRYKNNNDSNEMVVLLNKFVGKITPKGKILDLGSGAGFDSKYLSEKDFNVTGIDLADKLLEIAKENSPKTNFIKMDIRSLDFQPNSFDGIWAAGTLVHIPKTEINNLLEGIYKILKTNSIFYLSLKEGIGEEMKTNQGENNLNGATRFFAYYTEEEIKKLLTLNGFESIEITKDKKRGNTWLQIFAQKNN